VQAGGLRDAQTQSGSPLAIGAELERSLGKEAATIRKNPAPLLEEALQLRDR
jgi:hypothetical protein